MVQKISVVSVKKEKSNTSKGITFFPENFHRDEPFHLNSSRNFQVFLTNGKRSRFDQMFFFFFSTQSESRRCRCCREFSQHLILTPFDRAFLLRGGSRIFFRRGCPRLLLYLNTNKPHIFGGAEYQL